MVGLWSVTRARISQTARSAPRADSIKGLMIIQALRLCVMDVIEEILFWIEQAEGWVGSRTLDTIRQHTKSRQHLYIVLIASNDFT